MDKIKTHHTKIDLFFAQINCIEKYNLQYLIRIANFWVYIFRSQTWMSYYSSFTAHSPLIKLDFVQKSESAIYIEHVSFVFGLNFPHNLSSTFALNLCLGKKVFDIPSPQFTKKLRGLIFAHLSSSMEWMMTQKF